MLKIVGVGLSKTGTSSLNEALNLLGFKSIHYDTVRLNDVLDGSSPDPDFRRYDDVDAVTDLPAAYFYDELMAAYPLSKAILTIRDEEAWWRSIAAHFNELSPVQGPVSIGFKKRARYNAYRIAFEKFPADSSDRDFRTNLRNYVYGSTSALRFLYIKKYREHNERVVRTIAPDRLLVIDVTAGEGWEKLCPFLGREIPSVRFPHANRRARENAVWPG
jgi:hypothetical protein